MRYSAKNAALQGMIVLLILQLISCGGDSSSDEQNLISYTNAPPERIAEAGSTEALISFITGDVRLYSLDEERYPDIGDMVNAGERLITGPDGYAELQFESLAVIRIQADTEYILETISLNGEKQQVSGTLNTGSIIAKVRGLTGRDAFEVNVPGAVCAVRGTEFMVHTRPDGDVTVAVSHGAVSVAPPSLAAAGVPVTENTKEAETLERIQSLMPVVQAEEEFSFTSELMEVAEQEVVNWKKSVSEAEPAVEQREKFEERVNQALAEAPVPEPIAESNATLIRELAPEIITASRTTAPGASSDTGNTEKNVVDLVSLTIIVSPGDSRIFVDGKPSGRGSASRVFPEGRRVNVVVVSADETRQERDIIAGEQSLLEFKFEKAEAEVIEVSAPVETVTAEPEPEPEPEAVSLQIQTQPSSAVIYIDGKQAGRGSALAEGFAGETLRVEAEAAGYADETRNITLDAGAPALRINLKAQTIAAKANLPDAPVVGMASDRAYVIAASREGMIFAINDSGRIAWSRRTQNSGGEKTTPVISGNRVYVTGNTELVILSLTDGEVIARQSLSGDRSDLFGRHPAMAGSELWLPSDSKLISLNPESGAEQGTVDIPMGSQMSPTTWNGKVIIANQRGTLLTVDPARNIIESTVDTPSSQPIALAPTVAASGIAVFSGRKGNVSAVNLNSGTLQWSRALSESAQVKVHCDAVIENGVTYVFGEGRVYAMNLSDGGDRFPAISNVSAPPLVSDGILYLSRSDGTLSIHNASDGRALGSIRLGESSETRPAKLGPYVVVAGTDTVFVTDPRSITR